MKMKKVAIGEVSRGGGFPRLVREVEEAGEPIIITKKNGSVAVILPCPDEMEHYLNQYYGMTAAFASLARDSSEEAYMFLAMQAALGDAAKFLLSASGFDLSKLQAESNQILSQMADSSRNYSFLKNSLGESGSVSPMTTTRTSVSAVKEGELFTSDSSSLSRKRAKPSKNSPSPPPKRKIGTKQEKSV